MFCFRATNAIQCNCAQVKCYFFVSAFLRAFCTNTHSARDNDSGFNCFVSQTFVTLVPKQVCSCDTPTAGQITTIYYSSHETSRGGAARLICHPFVHHLKPKRTERRLLFLPINTVFLHEFHCVSVLDIRGQRRDVAETQSLWNQMVKNTLVKTAHPTERKK